MSPINLEKGQSIELSKELGLTKVFVGLGWDLKTSFFGSDIDLDASCLVFDERGNCIENIYFRNKSNSNRSIVHGGDNLTGEGKGDDEKIHVNLSNLSSSVKQLVFTINSFQGQTFEKVKNCFCRLVNDINQQELCRFDLDKSAGSYTGMVMCKVYLHNGEWKVKALAIPCNGKTSSDLINFVSSII